MKILALLLAATFASVAFGQTQRVTNLVATNDVKGLTFTSQAAAPAGSGVIRLGNGELIAWEASPAGTDVTLTVNSSEQFVFSAAILSPTLITPILGTPASGNGSNITNVNASTLGGATFAAPGPIGSGTPSTGAFTTITATTSLGVTGSTAGKLYLGQGTLPALETTAWQLVAPTSVTSYATIVPGAVGTGFWLGTSASGNETITRVTPGTGVATALTVNTGSAGAFQVNNASGAGLTSLTAANISAGALADGMTVTTQSPATNTTRAASGAYADASSAAAALAGMVSTYASPDTTGGAVTLTKAVTEVWTNTTTTYTIPAVASSTGKAIIFYVVGSNAITIDPNASEIIVRDGTAQTGGVTLTLTGTAGNYVCMVCDGTRWVTLGFKGTLAAGS